MSQAERPLFRETAIQQYLRKREKDILPHLVRPPTFLCCWLLAALLLSAVVLAWTTEVPVYAAAPGIILVQSSQTASGNQPVSGNRHVQALLFLPASYAHEIRAGKPCLVQIDSVETYRPCTLTRVQPGIWGPTEIRQHYQLTEESTAQVVTQPAVVTEADLGVLPQAQHYAGSQVMAQVQV